jgi:hypothetical protein
MQQEDADHLLQMRIVIDIIRTRTNGGRFESHGMRANGLE